MKKKQQKIQLTLTLIGILLVLITYFYYPYINKDKLMKNQVALDNLETLSDDKNTIFENVKYKGLYDLTKPFTVQSEKAYILNEEPDVLYMTNMHVILYLSDNRVVEITSLKGRYNKANFDCFFEQNVVASDGEITITAENLDLLAEKNIVEIYNDVNLNYPTASLLADKIDYNFETKYFKVSMFDDKTVKMKVIK